MFLLGVHPVEDVVAAGRGHPRRQRRRGARRGRRRRRARRGATSWFRPQGCKCREVADRPRHRPARGDGRLAGHGAVEVGPERHTARHVVVATGAEPIIPPVPGLRELDGVWTNREVTGMTAVPRRLLILGGGPVGVEMARPCAGSAATLRLSTSPTTCSPTSPHPGPALGEVLRRDGIELTLGVSRSKRDGTAPTTCSPSTAAPSCGGIVSSSRPVVGLGRRHRTRDRRHRARPQGHTSRRAPPRRRRPVGHRRHDPASCR